MIGRVEEIGGAVARLSALSRGGRSFDDILAGAAPGGPRLDLPSDPAALAARAAAAAVPEATQSAPAEPVPTSSPPAQPAPAQPAPVAPAQPAPAQPAPAPSTPNESDAPSALGATPVPTMVDDSWYGRLPDRGRPWAHSIETAATRHGVEPELLAALVWSESAFSPTAVSPAGAIGLGQLMPGTAAELGVDPWDAEQNLDGAARYLATQLDRFGSTELALAAYNAGPRRVAEAGGVPAIAETRAYVRIVDERHRALQGLSPSPGGSS